MNNSIQRTLTLCCCCVVLATAVALARDSDTPTGPPLPREVATGNFLCWVSVWDRPSGTGVPRASAGMSFEGTAGITDGGIGRSVNLGEGEGLDEECQALSATMRTAAQAVNCISGPIRFREIVGGNFSDKEWAFDVVCSDGRDRVMNAIGSLIAAIITTPLADEVIRTTGTADMIERTQAPIDAREWSSDAHPVERQLPRR